jgi:hypothetical protein
MELTNLYFKGLDKLKTAPKINYSLFTIHYSLFTIHYSLFTIHYSLFTIHYSLAAVAFFTTGRLYCIYATLQFLLMTRAGIGI